MTHISAVGHELLRLLICALFAAVFIFGVIACTDIIYSP